MRKSDDQCARADQITDSAVHLYLVVREARDSTAILKIAGKSVEHNALDLVLNFGGQLLDSVVDNGGSLAVWFVRKGSREKG